MRYIFAKVFNNSRYAEDFLRGRIRMGRLASFGIGNLFIPAKGMSNKYRGDLKEGLGSSYSVNSENPLETRRFFNEVYGLPKDVTFVGELDSRFLDENVLSLFALYYDDEQKIFIKPNKDMMKFDDKNTGSTVLITDPQEFIRRIVAKVSRIMGTPFWIAYGLVRYVLSDEYRGECDEFCKSEDYSWQQEFRIVIDVGGPSFSVKSEELIYDQATGAITIDIGDISEIAMLISTKSFVNLNLGDCYQKLQPKPNSLCPFYPPIKNRITYSCPVFAINNMMYIGVQMLYPIKRDGRNYRINDMLAHITAGTHPACNTHFLECAELYFSRLLDIVKASGNIEDLSALLTAIVSFMLMLGIRYLAGVYLAAEGDGVRPIYYRMDMVDESLVSGTDSYQNFRKKTHYPTNTDFAELVALSDEHIFLEYEYEGKRYCRIVVNQNATLSSGRSVSKGEAVWVEVSRLKWFELPE